MPSAAAELLADLAAVFSRHGLRWYVFGAQAVVAHGRPRLTEDVDVTVELGTLAAETLAAELQTAGFERSPLADDAFVAATRVLPFVHRKSGMPLDIVLAGPGLEELFLEQAELIDMGTITVPVIRLEHLLVTKILAGRRKDLEDASEILHGRGADVDVTAVRDLLGELEQALDRSDLIAVLDELLSA